VYHRREQGRIEAVALGCLLNEGTESLHPGLRFVV
jgi:hypothetical protein